MIYTYGIICVGHVGPEGTKRATSVNVQPPCLQKDLHTGSISRDIVNFPCELCRRRSGMFAEVARLAPPGWLCGRDFAGQCGRAATAARQRGRQVIVIAIDITLCVILS